MSTGRAKWESLKHASSGALATAGWLLRGCLGPRRPRPSAVFSGRTMGTYYRLTIVGRLAARRADELHELAGGQLEAVEARMSTYRPESEVSRFNTANHCEWFAVSRQTAQVVALALDISRRSGGAYDVTVGPLVDLWGFGPNRRRPAVPSEAEIADARRRVGPGTIEARLDPPAIRKTVPDAGIDLASIAKGFGVDGAAEVLDREGVSDYCVDVGGEVRVRGSNPDGRPWRIAVEVPGTGRQTIQRLVAMKSGSVASSGDYRIGFESDGHRYSHIIDPRTGCPIRHHLTSVTILHACCAAGDAWATALLVLGPKDGYDLAVREGIAALLIERGEGGFAERVTAGFPSESVS